MADNAFYAIISISAHVSKLIHLTVISVYCMGQLFL